MADIATISAALTSIKTAADLAKIIKDGDKTLEKAEIKYKLAELISALADAKMEIAEVRELVLSKDKELSALKDVLEQKKNMEWAEPYYFHVQDGQQDGPYCQQCIRRTAPHGAIRNEITNNIR
ncbi:hypothetical protein ETN89_19875 (plasmid) [Photobacterium damselae subsp. damselae]|uniref:hypothetical protein n=1 Tax=Photobacterium damselae TaxID=38293 RepID=UPI000A2F9902|nr:hypothetical protein [Photobacterium damselae]ARR51923.1 hypothetical protein CAY62_21210 [Photobacterium damselae subsp. damselae]QAY37524.1 hypothetical protein ETN89_19875 [Photobacterium damselae subsp. damselae]